MDQYSIPIIYRKKTSSLSAHHIIELECSAYVLLESRKCRQGQEFDLDLGYAPLEGDALTHRRLDPPSNPTGDRYYY